MEGYRGVPYSTRAHTHLGPCEQWGTSLQQQLHNLVMATSCCTVQWGESILEAKGEKQISTSPTVCPGILGNSLPGMQPHTCEKAPFWLLTEAGSAVWSFIPVLPCSSKGHSKVVCWNLFSKDNVRVQCLLPSLTSAWLWDCIASPWVMPAGLRMLHKSFGLLLMQGWTSNVHTRKCALEFSCVFKQASRYRRF